MTSTPAAVFPIGRGSFKPGFIFGAGSSACQVEGASNEGGRSPSIWDTFNSKKGLGLGNANDQYHRYKEDIALMKWMGLDSYRFSISWSRILPSGKKSGGVNGIGVQYYHDLIDELIANALIPYVTLFHWDVPQTLEDEYGGFLDPKILEDFQDFVDVCFMEFGNKVKYWTTVNEPMMFSTGGYSTGVLAPGHGDASYPPLGNTATEPYIVAHHLLLAHAQTVKLYREKYQHHQKGTIGLSLNGVWAEPLDPHSDADKKARDRYLDFYFNWFLDPVLRGSYPDEVKKVLARRNLKDFTKEETDLLRHSLDFVGLNYYTASYVRNMSNIPNGKESYSTDSRAEVPRKFLLGDNWEGSIYWLKVYPKGLADFVHYIDQKFKCHCFSGPIYITENGYGEKTVNDISLYQVLHDEKRVRYHHLHLSYLLEAINKYGINVKGYFIWSLFDNFEWNNAFTATFGTIHVDYKNDLKRYPKFSANWFKFILDKTHPVPQDHSEHQDSGSSAGSHVHPTILPKLPGFNELMANGFEKNTRPEPDVNVAPLSGTVVDPINSEINQ